MRYITDNDLHIHSRLSSCSNDPGQTPERILQYAKENDLKNICITDHFWDEKVPGASDWYAPQNFEHISMSKPLPKADGINFLFGCETELDMNMTLGLSKERFDEFDFIVIPTTHFHMTGFTVPPEIVTPEQKANLWLERFHGVLDMDLPFRKVGIAHLTCGLIAASRDIFLKTIDTLPRYELEAVFKKAAEKGVGIELNSSDMNFKEDERETVLRPYQIAKDEGCKFYLGSDAHHPQGLCYAIPRFERAAELLELTEDDKFRL